MPFSAEDFKALCHSRANGVAIVTVSRPQFKAAVVTEHSAAFPQSEEDECFVTLILSNSSTALKAIRASNYFALNYLRRSQLWIAEAIYKLLDSDAKKIEWSEHHKVPYLPSANAAVVCSLLKEVPMGPNTLVVGHVMGVHRHKRRTAPLVNYNQSYCTVGGKYVPVTHPSHHKKNRRLLKDKPKPKPRPPRR